MRNPLHFPHAYRVPQGKAEEQINKVIAWGKYLWRTWHCHWEINEEGWHVGEELAKLFLTFVRKKRAPSSFAIMQYFNTCRSTTETEKPSTLIDKEVGDSFCLNEVLIGCLKKKKKIMFYPVILYCLLLLTSALEQKEGKL